jgi:hypothetical protein
MYMSDEQKEKKKKVNGLLYQGLTVASAELLPQQRGQ